jgi:type I restriction enzyme S subunit
VALSEVVQFLNAKPHEKFVTDDGTVELLTARFISTSGRSVRRVLSQNVLTPALCHDVAMVMSDLPNGRALARCFYVDANDKYAANQRVCLLRVLDKSAIFPRYLYHFLDRNPQLLKYDNGQDQTHLKKGEILDVRVPKIEFSEQVHVAATLDRLDSGIGSLQSAIDEESLVRRKQYEYYRDKLLTFEEAPA